MRNLGVAGSFQLRISHNSQSDIGPGTVIWRLDWDWRFCCQDGSFQVGRKLRPSPCGPIHRTSWVSSQHSGWLHPEQGIGGSKEESAMSFVIQPSRAPSATSTISTGHTCQPGQCGGDCGRGLEKAQIPKAKDLCMPSWRLATTEAAL